MDFDIVYSTFGTFHTTYEIRSDDCHGLRLLYTHGLVQQETFLLTSGTLEL
jgi:hypothetical protein